MPEDDCSLCAHAHRYLVGDCSPSCARCIELKKRTKGGEPLSGGRSRGKRMSLTPGRSTVSRIKSKKPSSDTTKEGKPGDFAASGLPIAPLNGSGSSRCIGCDRTVEMILIGSWKKYSQTENGLRALLGISLMLKYECLRCGHRWEYSFEGSAWADGNKLSMSGESGNQSTTMTLSVPIDGPVSKDSPTSPRPIGLDDTMIPSPCG